jgi:hypothetical protein
MKLPQLQMSSAPEWQRLRFRRWLAEWEIEQELRLCDRDEASQEQQQAAVEPIPVMPLSEEPEIRMGQIRLLSPEGRPTHMPPFFVAVLDDSGPSACMAAPYSRFAEPCTPGEFLTGRQTPCLRVLCLWNTQNVARNILAQSWVVDRLSAREMSDTLDVLKSLDADSKAPRRLRRRIGPPLWHPHDPRAQYLTEETDRMKTMCRLEAGKGVAPESEGAALLYSQQPGQLPLAAEPRSPYETNPTQPPDHEDNSESDNSD